MQGCNDCLAVELSVGSRPSYMCMRAPHKFGVISDLPVSVHAQQGIQSLSASSDMS